jgi:hypothetical protein
MSEDTSIDMDRLIRENPGIDLEALKKRHAYLAKRRGLGANTKKGYHLAPPFDQHRASTTPRETRTIYLQR